MGALFGLLSALCIGVSDLFARRVVNRSGADQAGLAVNAFAFLTSVATLLVFGSTLRAYDFAVGVGAGVLMGLGIWLYYRALAVSTATIVAPIVGALSAVVPFLYAVVRGSAPSWVSVGGAFVAISGIVVISTGSSASAVQHATAPPPGNSGRRLSVASGLSYGCGLAILLETSTGAGALPAIGQRISSATLLVAIVLRSSKGASDRTLLQRLVPPRGVRRAAVLAGLFAGFASLTYLAGVHRDPTPAITTSSMFPVASVVVGRIFFADALSRRQILGLLVSSVGVAAVVAG